VFDAPCACPEGNREPQVSALLAGLPGLLVFLVGLVYGVFFALRNKRASLLAARIRVLGIALLLLLPAAYLAWQILAGHADPVAWLGVGVLALFGGFQIVLLKGLSIPTEGH